MHRSWFELCRFSSGRPTGVFKALQDQLGEHLTNAERTQAKAQIEAIRSAIKANPKIPRYEADSGPNGDGFKCSASTIHSGRQGISIVADHSRLKRRRSMKNCGKEARGRSLRRAIGPTCPRPRTWLGFGLNAMAARSAKWVRQAAHMFNMHGKLEHPGTTGHQRTATWRGGVVILIGNIQD